MLKTISIALILLAASLSAQPLLTLEDAIALGLKNSYSIQIARNQAEAAANNRGLGVAGLLPTLNATGSYGVIDNKKESDPPAATENLDITNLAAELSLNWTIFDGFNMFISHSLYRQLARQGEYQARDQIEQTIVAISMAYFNLVQQEQLEQVARDTRAVSESRLDRERVRHELGGASSTDFLQSQVVFNSDQSNLLNSELQVTIARQQLNILLGQDPATTFAVETEIDIPELTLSRDQVFEAAEANNASLKAAELGHNVARRQVQSARSAFMPRLSAFAEYSLTDQTLNSDAEPNPNIDLGTKTTGPTVGLALSFNLFNGTHRPESCQNPDQALIGRHLPGPRIGREIGLRLEEVPVVEIGQMIADQDGIQGVRNDGGIDNHCIDRQIESIFGTIRQVFMRTALAVDQSLESKEVEHRLGGELIAIPIG